MRLRSSSSVAALALLLHAGCGPKSSDPLAGRGEEEDATTVLDGGTGPDAAAIDAGATSSLVNRDRLLGSYFDHLKAHPDDEQSNGLIGRDLIDVCDLWSKLDSSSRNTFLTVTARLEGSILGADQTPALDHVTQVYRIAGGEGAQGTDPGSCGGGEFNRLIMSMDAQLHASLVAANDNGGDRGPDGNFDVADIPEDESWRDSGDAAGPHDPFDLSDETDEGAPRGQVHFFRDPASELASLPLGRLDVEELVDPFALEMDQDYDCPHNSNPNCEYTFYGPLCAPQSTKLGVDIYGDNYGAIDPDWRPSGCP